MASIQELTQELSDHITLAQQGLARSEFADQAVMQPVDIAFIGKCVPVEQVTEFCELVQSSLSTILATARQAGV